MCRSEFHNANYPSLIWEITPNNWPKVHVGTGTYILIFFWLYIICHYLPSTHHTSNRLLCNHEIHAVFFCVKSISQQHFWRHVQVIINVLIIPVEPRPFPNPAPTAKWPNLYGITGGRKPRGGWATPGGQVVPADWAKAVWQCKG